MRPEFHLTPEEEILVENSEWLLMKQRIIGKVFGVFGGLNEDYKTILKDYHGILPEEVLRVSGKIYKGEHYRQLPYVMLDQPRYFKAEDTFAIRSLFWWGNHFSIHLVLGGAYKRLYEHSLQTKITSGELDDWYIGISENPWEHYFEDDNYIPVSQYKKDNSTLPSATYFKLAKYHPLADWKNTRNFYLTTYKLLLKVVL